MMSSSKCRLDLRVGPSDDHRYSSSPAAIAAESSQHHLSLLVSASSVTTTTVVTVRNINTASVDLSSVYTEAGAPINSFITTVCDYSYIIRGLRVPKVIISLALFLSDNMSRSINEHLEEKSSFKAFDFTLYIDPLVQDPLGAMIVKEMMNQTALLLWHKAQPVFHLLDLFPEQALKRNQMLFQQGKPQVNQLRAEHSTLLGRLGDMNQKYDAAAVDNRILRADIETREQKYILLRLIKETVKRVTGVNPLQWARPNMGMQVNNTPRIPSTTGAGLSPNRE
ncbi:hypothetical protein F2Q69_00002304 [Brassica cretica]|uniref:Uncharacterized protein n=1 Tax=Brassica cretica TaxID=69181 RepID=A0A8S9PAE8_BRACR|nr:hypothetical protein F2Q69_00002304 [Brassica cretica]